MTKVAHKTLVNNRRKHDDPIVSLEENYQWTGIDYAQAPLAFIIGSLHALPDETNGPYCSGNSTSLRSYILEGSGRSVDVTEEQDKKERAFAYYTGGTYLDEVGVDCQIAVTSTLDRTYWENLAANAP